MQNSEQSNKLLKAADMFDVSGVKEALDAAADVNTQDTNGRTSLIIVSDFDKVIHIINTTTYMVEAANDIEAKKIRNH